MPAAEPCVLVIFGASGDLTRRLLMPALYNMACEGLLSRQSQVVGLAMDSMTSEEFREHMRDNLGHFTTRAKVDPGLWEELEPRLHYLTGRFDDPELYHRLEETLDDLRADTGAGSNVLFYLATPPFLFASIAKKIAMAGLHRPSGGWKRLVVEKPFGRDLASAEALNKSLLADWSEDQLFRIDHYLGKETVQNLLAFRFSNGLFEPLWNRQQIDHIQFTVSESVGVERRGRYYDHSGALRDMVQNHMFQMLAYLCMEPPSSLRADHVRNEKAKLLDAVRVLTPEQVLQNTVRGQYGGGSKPDGTEVRAYRDEPDVDPGSNTETFAALRLDIDNWRWEGVPIYLRTGKSLWKRGTEIVVQFKRAPEVIFRESPEIGHLEPNQLIFHIQPDQGIELRFQAKVPGAGIQLQRVDMRFDYQEAFEASRSTGYEVLLYHAMRGDQTLFTRADLVEAAWRVTQPILDTWADNPPRDFPNYPAGGWGPRDAYDLVQRDGRKWIEIINRDVLERVPILHDTSPVFLHGLTLVLKPAVFETGDVIVEKGDPGNEMYVVARGEVEVTDDGRPLATLGEGDFFGELSLLLEEERTATVMARTACDLYVLNKSDFLKVLREHPRFASSIVEVSKRRYRNSFQTESAFDDLLARLQT